MNEARYAYFSRGEGIRPLPRFPQIAFRWSDNLWQSNIVLISCNATLKGRIWNRAWVAVGHFSTKSQFVRPNGKLIGFYPPKNRQSSFCPQTGLTIRRVRFIRLIRMSFAINIEYTLTYCEWVSNWRCHQKHTKK